MKYLLPSIAFVACLFLASCGTTSSLEDGQGNAIVSTRKFSKITVQDFTSTVEDDEDGVAKGCGEEPFS